MSNSPNTRKYLTEDELKRLLHVVKGRKSPRDEAIFLVTYWRGLRASEVGRIPFSAWNQSKRRLFVTRLKGSLSGEFPLSKAEQSALNAWLKIRGSAPGPLGRRRPVPRLRCRGHRARLYTALLAAFLA